MSQEEPEHGFGLVPSSSMELTVAGGKSWIVVSMIDETLALARKSSVAQVELDALVSEAKRLSDDKGEKMSEDNIQAFNLFLRAAVCGHSEAQYRVSRRYREGCGIQEDLVESEQWLRKATANEFPTALFFLGVAYLSGTLYQTVAKDEDEAIKWFLKAADKGYATACLLVSDIYKERNDDAEALKWTKEAALRGCTDTLWSVKEFYKQQELTKVDLVEAHAWLSLFADLWPAEDTKAGEMEALMSPSELEKANQLHRHYTEKRSEWARQAPELCYFR